MSGAFALMQSSLDIHRYSESTKKSDFIETFSNFHSLSAISTQQSLQQYEKYTRLLLNYSEERQSEFWIAYERGTQKVVCRLGADIPKNQHQFGSIGFLESQLDAQGKSASIFLIQQALLWLQENKVKSVFGPMDFNSWFKYRFKSQSNSGAAMVTHPWEPATPQIHVDAFRQTGFKEDIKFSSFNFEVSDNLIWDAYISRLHKDHEQAMARGLSIREINWQMNIADDLRAIFEISTMAFAQNPMFEPIPFEIFLSITEASARATNANGSRICFSKDGQPVGFLFAFNLNDMIVLKTIAVVPGFQSIGIANAMTYELCQFCRISNIRKSVGALIRQGNTSERIGHGFGHFASSTTQDEYVLMKRTI